MPGQKIRPEGRPRVKFNPKGGLTGQFRRISGDRPPRRAPGGGWLFFRVRGLGSALLALALVSAPLSCVGGTNSVADSAGSASESTRPEPKPLPPLGRALAHPAADDWSLETHRTIALVPQNLVLSLPQGHVWESVPRRGTWSGLRHEVTESELWVRHVAARRTVSLAECEKEARLSWALIRESHESAVDRDLRAPAGYGGKLSVILLPDGGGRIEAFSVGVSRCLAVVFTTQASPGFPERLRVAANEVLETMRVPNVGERSRPVRMTPY